ncbi:GAF domain-containing protein [soil metagenome]
MLTDIVDNLIEELRACSNRDDASNRVHGDRLKAAFHHFGSNAAMFDLTLDEAMSGAITALRLVLNRDNGLTEVSETMTAGLAFAAVATGYTSASNLSASSANATHSDATLKGTQVRQLRALHRISRAASTSTKPSQLLEASVRAISVATQSDACAVFLHDEATATLSLWGAVGLNPASIGALSISIGEGITGLAALNREPIVASDAQSHPAWIGDHNFGDIVYASQASIPIMIEAPPKLVGVLNVLSTDRRQLSDEDISFLRNVASELAIGIEFSRLRSLNDQQLSRKITELGTLQRLSRTVASSLSLSDVLRLIAEAAAELTNAEAAALFRLPSQGSASPDQGTPVIEYRYGHNREAADEMQRDKLVQHVIESGAARVVDMEYVDGPSRLYCLPLRSARERWGALCVRLAPGAELFEDELALLQAFTDTASIAIENAQLYREARNGVETASALLQEMHHRVRNNLQTLAALLSLQMRQVDDEQTIQQLQEAAGRVQAIASVHDLLSDEKRLSGASIEAIARMVAEQATVTQKPASLALDFNIQASDIVVPSKQATVLALLINELVSNAITHGFKGRSSGIIDIKADRSDGHITIKVVNNGSLISDEINASSSKGLGLRIVERLAQFDLNGTFSIQPSPAGTVAEIVFPEPPGNAHQSARDSSSGPRSATA